jgi:hypothetical protein
MFAVCQSALIFTLAMKKKRESSEDGGAGMKEYKGRASERQAKSRRWQVE